MVLLAISTRTTSHFQSRGSLERWLVPPARETDIARTAHHSAEKRSALPGRDVLKTGLVCACRGIAPPFQFRESESARMVLGAGFKIWAANLTQDLRMHNLRTALK